MSSTQIIASTSNASTNTDIPTSDTSSTIKRKLEDAIHILDQAVAPSPVTTDRPTPAKKPRTNRSLYSTLAKYGIRRESKDSTPSTTNEFDNLSKTAPHLAAILSRTASRTKKAFPFKSGLNSSSPILASSSRPASEYRPSSTQSFLSRLATFKLTTYANKAPAVDAVAAAKCGWINDGKDRLVCGICDVSWVVAGTHGMSRDAANALVEKQRAQLVDMHKDGCPWKTRQCDASIYRIPLQAPLAMAREIKARAILLDSVLQGVEIKHPLTSNQVAALTSTISSVRFRPPVPLDTDSEQTNAGTSSELVVEPSSTAVLTALFGWAILPPAPPTERARTPSLSRANSVAPSTPGRSSSIMPSTPMRRLSGSPSVASSREGTPTPSTPRRISNVQSSPDRATPRPDTTLLHCSLCQRRIGLWAFMAGPSTEAERGTTPSGSETPRRDRSRTVQKRQLDVLKEHRSYCPYVVRSTVVPSLPTPSTPPTPSHTRSGSVMSTASVSSIQVHTQPGALEGWRAVLMVVLRYGMAQRQRLGLTRTRSSRLEGEAEGGASAQDDDMEVDAIEAMVAGVKSRGGRDLLKYVKGLLG